MYISERITSKLGQIKPAICMGRYYLEKHVCYNLGQPTLYELFPLASKCFTVFSLLFSLLCPCLALLDCGSLSESSQCNRILHNTELVSICRSHICHHRLLITVNPFTSRKAGVNPPRAMEYLYPLVPKSHYVFYTAQFPLSVMFADNIPL